MIVLDTHVWIWWVRNDPQLPPAYRQLLYAEENNGLGVSVFSLWEIAMLHSHERLTFPVSCREWIERALTAQGVQTIPLTPEIAVDSANLPGQFHRDPADQVIVASDRALNCPLVTLDRRIRGYPHVLLAP
jgi:PIN domain nuclease of toxin-antitoxin system